MPLRGMPGAFHIGIVKNKLRSDSELLQISGSAEFALLDYRQSRDKLRVKN
jgi:hypothetical protein